MIPLLLDVPDVPQRIRPRDFLSDGSYHFKPHSYREDPTKEIDWHEENGFEDTSKLCWYEHCPHTITRNPRFTMKDRSAPFGDDLPAETPQTDTPLPDTTTTTENPIRLRRSRGASTPRSRSTLHTTPAHSA